MLGDDRVVELFQAWLRAGFAAIGVSASLATFRGTDPADGIAGALRRDGAVRETRLSRKVRPRSLRKRRTIPFDT